MKVESRFKFLGADVTISSERDYSGTSGKLIDLITRRLLQKHEKDVPYKVYVDDVEQERGEESYVLFPRKKLVDGKIVNA